MNFKEDGENKDNSFTKDLSNNFSYLKSSFVDPLKLSGACYSLVMISTISFQLSSVISMTLTVERFERVSGVQPKSTTYYLLKSFRIFIYILMTGSVATIWSPNTFYEINNIFAIPAVVLISLSDLIFNTKMLNM
ncbi:hypothetical protein HDU92_004167 [Lobulomyces angularis]|nr:hypothetical protein HDU92_004167 [Lobulomyces angularis]